MSNSSAEPEAEAEPEGEPTTEEIIVTPVAITILGVICTFDKLFYIFIFMYLEILNYYLCTQFINPCINTHMKDKLIFSFCSLYFF